MMLSDRLPLRDLWLGLIVASGVLAGMAALRVVETDTLGPAPAPVIRPDDTALCAACPTRFSSDVGVCFPVVESVQVRAERLYRAHRFADAAEVVRAEASGDVDLQNLAEQYAQLASMWQIAMSPDTQPTTAFYALREAWKLDTVLGGAFGDELTAAVRANAPKALAAFERNDDIAGVRLVSSTVTALGL